MSEEFQKNAYEPFAQEKSSARSKYVGTGLGLAIAKKMIEDAEKAGCKSAAGDTHISL